MTRARIILAVSLMFGGIVAFLWQWLARGDFGAGVTYLVCLWLAGEAIRPGVDAIDRTADRRRG